MGCNVGDKIISPEKIIRITAEILLKYFSDGLAINDDKQFNEFRDYLEDALGDEADRFFASKVREFVKQAGVRVGEFVFPKKNAGTNSSVNVPVVKDKAYYHRVIKSVLLRFFAEDGFKLDSAADYVKMRTLAGSEFRSWSDRNISACVKYRNPPFEGVCYPIKQRTIDRIQETFEKIFQSGCKIIYYSALFDKNKIWLVSDGIFNARFLKDRMRVFFRKLIHYENYFEQTPDDLSEIEKVRNEILRIWTLDEKSEKSVGELVDQTFVIAEQLEETLERRREFEKDGEKWKLVPEDELEADIDVLLIEPFDFYPLGKETQQYREERRRSQEDVLQVPDDYEEPQEFETVERSRETGQEVESTRNEAVRSELELGSEQNDAFPSSSNSRFDFNAPKGSVASLKPVLCRYKGETLVKASSWSKLYAAVATKLFEEHSQTIRSKINQSLGTWNKPDFVDKTKRGCFNRPVEIANNVYIEVNSSVYDVSRRIKAAFELCGIDINDLEIWIRKNESTSKVQKNIAKLNQNDAKISSNALKPTEDDLERKSKDRNVSSEEKSTKKPTDEKTQEVENKTVDEEKFSDAFIFDYGVSHSEFTYTKPLLCVYKNEAIIQDCSWRKLYCVLVARLFRDYPDVLLNAVDRPLGKKNSVDFSNEKSRSRFKKPFKIAENLYVESEPIAFELVQRIKRVLKLCGVPFDDLTIWSRNASIKKSPLALQRTIFELKKHYGYVSAGMPDDCVLFANTPDVLSSQDSNGKQKTTQNQVKSNDKKLKEKVLRFLNERCPNGFSLESIIELERLRLFLEELGNDETVPISDQELLQAVSEVGETFEDKVYAISKETDARIRRTVTRAFDNGSALIFYDQLYGTLRFKLPDFFSENLLKARVEKLCFNLCRFTQNYFEATKDQTSKTNGSEIEKISAEIKRAWGDSVVLSYTELDKRLPYVSLEKIKTTLSVSKEFIRNVGQGYARVDLISIEEQEKIDALNFVEREIQVNQYALLKDLPIGKMEFRNEEVEPEALRKILFQACLDGRFQLNKRVITKLGESLTVQGVVKNLCRNLERISLEELYDKERETTGELHYLIALGTGYDLFVRTSRDEFVSSRRVDFDVEKIDRCIDETLGEKERLPLKAFTSFEKYPSAGFAWNPYLLESFCLKYSRQFRLNRQEVNSTNIGVVERVAYKKDYDTVLVEAVAEANIPLEEDSVLNYLALNGYINSRRYAKIERLVKDAGRLRRKEEF